MEIRESERIKRSLMAEKSANPLWCFQLFPVTSGSRIAVGKVQVLETIMLHSASTRAVTAFV